MENLTKEWLEARAKKAAQDPEDWPLVCTPTPNSSTQSTSTKSSPKKRPQAAASPKKEVQTAQSVPQNQKVSKRKKERSAIL